MLSLILVLASCNATDDPPLPQSKPWTPPETAISRDFLEATAFLLKHGLADPRGGEYREATITIRDTWRGEAQKVPIHGWVFPDKTIVAWDGLSYKAASTGPEADLEKDVVLPRERQPIAAFGHGVDLSPCRTSVGTALLLILGKAELAERSQPDPISPNKADTFLMLSNQYLVRRFHRAIEAHMGGDDRLALEDARILEQAGPRFEEEALRLFGADDVKRRFASSLQRSGETKVFAFLNPVPELVSDSERRLKVGVRSIDLATIGALPSSQRIMRLIEALEEVKARQSGQPGGVNVIEDPIAAALASEGEAALEPLIDVIEGDKRLTRSVSFGRDFFPHRSLISVSSAAYAIVSDILQLSLSSRERYRKYSVDELRAFWRENKGKSRAERLFAILADDSGESQQWLEAAQQIVQASDVRRSGSWVSLPQRNPGEPSPSIVGEELRTKSSPSVADLMAKRAVTMAGTGELRSSGDQFACADALRVGLALAKWDLKASVPTLAMLMKRAVYLATYPNMQGNAAEAVYSVAGRVTARQIQAGDTGAWEDYRTLLATFKVQGFLDPMVFEAFWTRPNERKSKELAAQVFLSPSSSFVKSLEQYLGGALDRIVQSPMPKVPAVREMLLRFLSDKTVVGTVSKRDKNGIRWEVGENGKGGSGGMSLVRWEQDGSSEGDKQTLRTCDRVALEIFKLKGAPHYNPTWPGAKRDQAIKELGAYFRRVAPNIESVLPDHMLWRFREDF